MPDDRVARRADLGHGGLEDEKRGGAEAREDQGLLDDVRPGAAEPDGHQRAEERVDRVAVVAPAPVQPALEAVGAGDADQGAPALEDPHAGIGELGDVIDLVPGVEENAHGRGRLRRAATEVPQLSAR